MMRRALLVLVPWLGLAACGGLDSPDLATGRVRGLLSNATSGAYVYPLGRPDLKVSVAADGRYVIDRVPDETVSLVVVDGVAGDLTRKAQLLPVHVEDAEESEAAALDAAAMPLAGRVVATVQLACGAYASSPRFTAVGTEHVGVAAVAGVAELDPLPAGNFELVASMQGFRNGTRSVDVTAGATTAYTVPLDVDTEDGERGCLATGCRNGLVCNPGDGVCYQCNANADCDAAVYGVGATCEQHSCRSAPGTPGPVCALCMSSADCQTGLFCAPDGAGGGYCTRSCGTSYDCGGLACQYVNGIAPKVCVAPGGCSSYRSALGTPCFENDTCAGILVNGVCKGQTSNPPAPGYCTASCSSTPADMCAAVQGFACTGMTLFCTPTP